ncbi:MAG: septum formation initiator family protein [Bacteroidaceae bacterium]|nr:septum formation initiator family protein [Bacteroidaceae bacterium]
MRNLLDFIGKHQYLIVLVLFVLVITVANDNSLVRRAAVRSEIRSLKGQIERLDREMTHDREMLEELSSDSMIIEHLARERYNMQKPDEDVFIEQK